MLSLKRKAASSVMVHFAYDAHLICMSSSICFVSSMSRDAYPHTMSDRTDRANCHGWCQNEPQMIRQRFSKRKYLTCFGERPQLSLNSFTTLPRYVEEESSRGFVKISEETALVSL